MNCYYVGDTGLEPVTSAMSTQFARHKLDAYLGALRTRGLTIGYINKVRELLSTYLNSVRTVSAETAIDFLGLYVQRKPNTRARYATYLKGYLSYLGIVFSLKVKVPKMLPPIVNQNDIETLVEAIKAKKNHKQCMLRDLVLIETACKTGLRRSELANLKVKDIDIKNGRLKVVGGKGGKDRVIPLANGLKDKLNELCQDKNLDDRVFGFTPSSLGMKIYVWAKKAGVEIHTHSLRHYFGTTLADRGAHIRAIQELMGHDNLATTEAYLSITGRHLNQAIQLLE